MNESSGIDLRVLLGDTLLYLRRTAALFAVLTVVWTAVLCLHAHNGLMYRASATCAVSVVGQEPRYSPTVAGQLTRALSGVFASGLPNECVQSMLNLRELPSISFTALDSAGIFTLDVISDDPQLAWDVLNALLSCCPEVAEPIVGKIEIELLDESGLPIKPYNTNDGMATIGHGVLSIAFVWLSASFVLASLRSTVHNEDELCQLLGLRVLGVLPAVRSRGKSNVVFPRLDPSAGDTAFSEAVCLLAMHVETQLRAQQSRVLLVSSAVFGEGKTTVALNLAAALTAEKRRVLLIECDLRSPCLVQALGLNCNAGLTELLRGEAAYPDVLCRSSVEGLFLVPGGVPTGNAPELLSGNACRVLLDLCRKEYDYVLLDTPPTALLSDASELATLADGALLTVRQNFASRERLSEAAQVLSDSGLPLIGCVLNCAGLPFSRRKAFCRLQTLPNVSRPSGRPLRDVRAEELLGRERVQVDESGIGASITGKTVLVTGGGGSIGSELCRQIAACRPARLVIFDIYENNAYAIQQELRFTHPELALTTLVGSVRDRARVEELFERYRPQIVCHAAAHKHVPLMEDSPNEAVKNNILGTRNVARAADRYGAERFVLISSDKAVNPVNVMGASKRVCEMIVQVLAQRSKTCFSAVRFGNVLGSNGSVIPLFRAQIERGGPVTVTHREITRYFMTIPEAVSLVLQACCCARGGEVFVLDMGEPVRIDDLARSMIRLSGLEPDVDIPVVYTGLRPGEKLYEELMMNDEGLEKTPNDHIFIGRFNDFDRGSLLAQLDRLEEASNCNSDDIRTLLMQVVPTYRPAPNAQEKPLATPMP